MAQRLCVGVLSPFVGGDYYGAIIAGVAAAVAARGGQVIAIQTLPPGAHSADGAVPDLTSQVAWRHVDGFIVIVGAVDRHYLRRLRRAGKRVVLVSHQFADLRCASVMVDNARATEQVVGHLVVEHGHRRIGFVGHTGANDVRERYDGYARGLRKHSIGLDRDLVHRVADNHETGGVEGVERMLARRDVPRAIVAGTDRNAIGVMRRLREAGYRVPDDVAIVGFDDITPAAYAVPSLTTVGQALETLGRTAVEVLTNPADDTRRHDVETQFVVRESCGCGSGTTAPLYPLNKATLDLPTIDLDTVDRRTLSRTFYEHSRDQYDDITYLHTILNVQYEMGMDLLRSHERDPRQLGWLRRTPVRGGCLALWLHDPRSAVHPTDADLCVTASFAGDTVPVKAGVQLPVSAFPPPRFVDVATDPSERIVFVVPVRTGERDWGMLATVDVIQSRTPPGRELMNQSAALLAVALAHQETLATLRDQEDRLRRAALYDQLTGLPNRSLFMDRLGRSVLRGGRDEAHRFALLFLDLDGFKNVNDTLGHGAGDQLLVQVADRIRAEVRADDTAARFGGDEFVLLVDPLEPDAALDKLTARIEHVLSTPFELAEGVARISVSVGTVVSADGVKTAEDLLREADRAMYEIKSRRKLEREHQT